MHCSDVEKASLGEGDEGRTCTARSVVGELIWDLRLGCLRECASAAVDSDLSAGTIGRGHRNSKLFLKSLVYKEC